MATPFCPVSLSLIPNPNSPNLILSQLSFAPILKSPARKSCPPYCHNSIIPNKSTTIWWSLSSTNPEFLLAEEAPIENYQEITVPPSDDVSSTVISGLLLVAFVGLSILTVGVIYIAVTDFLQKRERDKFEEEEAAANRKKKRGRKGVALTRARGGPRGFGQKVEEDDDFDGAD